MESDRSQLDTLQRERDRLASEKNQLNSTVSQQEDEISQLKRKCERLTNELDDYGTSGKDDAEVVTVCTVCTTESDSNLRCPSLRRYLRQIRGKILRLSAF